ncbi:Hsp20/alpha crystallin family protein [Thermococcus waiotapuensis]|uniref:Hsp20/alpha crystallin family protein n=1 Tax=Thermococcus waiotapuensis TaxID=90909 RepID=A0AAE4NV46_9EURY|nr:Hsp20/alpha crystallin family protein [Thermococcus waiotapuensis]MDV3103201.1 Hsp20/alpha crystallin family protein [Thermococcus waiotapuensis]
MAWRRDRYWDPFDLMREIQEEIDAIFRDMMRGPRLWSWREPEESITTSETWREPFADIFDRGDKFVITVELPGVRKEDIKLRVTEDTVYIEAQMKREKELEREGAIRIERYYSGYRRVIRLPEEVIPEKAKARYNNGVLEIEVPKKNPTKPETEGFEVKIE